MQRARLVANSAATARVLHVDVPRMRASTGPRDTTVTETTATASAQSHRTDARDRAAPSIKSLFRSLGVTARYVTRNAKPARNTRRATRGRFMRAFDRLPAKPCETGVCDARPRLWRGARRAAHRIGTPLAQCMADTARRTRCSNASRSGRAR